MKRNSRWLMVGLVGTFIRNNLFTLIGFGVIAGRDYLSLFLMGIGVIMFILLPLYCFTNWYFKKYETEAGNFHYHRGVFVKKRQSVPIEKIANIELEENFFHQIVKRTRVKIDTGNQNEEGNQLIFLLKREDAWSLKTSLLSNEKEKIEEEEWAYQINNRQVFLYGLTRSSLFPLLSLAFSFFFFLQEVGQWFNYKLDVSTGDVFIYLLKNEFLFLFVMLLLIYLLSKVLMAIFTYVQYYGFSIRKEEEKMIVQYGYFTKKRKEIPKERLYGIILKQSPFFQLFGYYQIEGCLVGQDQYDEKTLLFLMGKKELTSQFIHQMMPQFEYKGNALQAKRENVSMFFVVPLSILLVITVIATLTIGPMYLFILLLAPIIILYFYLEYKNGKLGGNKALLYGATGGYFHKIYIAHNKGIQSYTESQSYFQKRKNLQTLRIALWNQNFKVRHLKEPLRIKDDIKL